MQTCVGYSDLIIDSKRPPKTLRASHARGTTPVLRAFGNEHEEADFVAIEIKRLVALSGGMLKWSDFAILRKSLQGVVKSLES